MVRYLRRMDGVARGIGALVPVRRGIRMPLAALVVLVAAVCGLFLSPDVSAQCTHTYTAVPLNVQQTYTFVTDGTNTRTFAITACDPNARGVFDTYAHALLAEQAEEGPIPGSQIVGAIFGTFYVGGTTGAEYIQYTPTSNPGFAYGNTVTFYTNSSLLGPVLQTIVMNVLAAPLPTITSISTTAGPTLGGSSFTITGTNLTGATGVSFGGTAATSFTVNSATSITVTSPAHAAGLVDITVTTPNGTSATSTADQYTFVTPPVLTSLTPIFGTTAGGTTVTITGTNLSNATQILFNGTAGTGISSTATSASVTTPAHAAGQVDVTVTTAGGTTALVSADHYTFVAPPVAGASSATVAYNSSANAVTLNTSGGPTSVTVASTPAHGSAIASGTNITYTPTSGYFGSDSFTYTATNSVGTSTAATVSITVSGPTITVTPTTLTAGTFGTAYSQTLSASGGQSPYTFSTTLASGALPAGLSLSSAGVISGTPMAAGTFTFSVSGTDSSTTSHAGFTSTNISLTVAPIAPGAPTIGTATAGNGQASVSFTAPGSSGGAAITSYTVTSSPGGFSATGSSSPLTVTGLTNGTAYTFTATATNSAGTSVASSSSNSVTPVGMPVAGASSATVAYNSTSNNIALNLSGGTPTSVTVTSAASHGTATASGTSITYTPVTGYFGSDSFAYTATNGFGTSSAATVSVTVSAPTISVTPTTLASGVTLTAYSQTLTASGGKAPYTFSTTLASGALPTGVSLSSTGVVSGTPVGIGTYTFTVTGTDSSTLTHASFTSGTITLIINSAAPLAPGAPTIGTATAGNAQATVGFTPPALNGGATITSYTVTSSPSGITASGASSPITVTGLTNGTTYTFTVTATNSAGTGLPSFASNSLTPIAPPIAGAANATVAYGTSANVIALNLSGGAPTSVAVASAASHGSASASGTTITYTPTTGYIGSDSFTYTATNGSGTSSAATASITVSGPIISITPTTLTSDTVGSAYSQTLSASGGQAPYTFSTTVASGALPAGLSLSSTGNITGTPTTAGTSTFTVSGTDSSTPSHASFTSATISLTVNAVLAGAPTIGTATAGDTQAVVTFTAPASTGGSPITGYTVTSSPGGITASSSASPITVTGLTDGTSYTFTVTATNAAGTSSASAASNAVTPLASPVAGASSVTVAYNSSANPVTLTLSGGVPSSVAVASAASHGTATASGTTITYTPTAGYFGSDSFTYTATNSSGTSSTATVSVTITAPTIAVTPATLAAGTLGTAYSQILSASGGQAPYTFATSVASGALPSGLALASSGAITGTPTAAGTFTFTVNGTDSSTVTHASFTSATISLTISPIAPGAPTIGVASAGNAQASVAFTAPASNGGAAITSYTVTSSPGGLTASGSASPITVTGLTNGTAYTFTVTATNSAGTGSASASSNSVTPIAPPVAGAVSATVAYNSSASPITLNLSGGAATSVTVASAASHGTATASGTTITYTPSTGFFGSDSFTYTATNSYGTSSAATVSVTVSAPSITVSPTTLPSGTLGTAYSHALTASGGQSPYIFSTTVASGSLPAGLSLSSAGVITGTPTAVGTSTFTVSGTDSSTLTHASFTSSTITLAVTALLPGSPTIGTATAGNAQATVTFSAPASNGGTAITSYTVTSSPGGITANGPASPITVTGLTNGTAYTFTATATNSIGTGPASAASNSVTPILPPISGVVNATVAYNSSANPITLSLSGGAASSISVASAAGHGTATASGTTITYTPTTGFFGSDSFTYMATNGSGTSAASAVNITISAPTISVTPATLAAGTDGSAYSQTLSASGGQAPYTFSMTLASGSLPAGLSLSSTGAITGTPTVTGSFTFTVSGTDSSTATHASFTSATISLTVNAATPGAPTIGTATPGDTQASVSFTAPASNGGAAITSYTVTSSPGGLTGTGSASPIVVTGLANGTAYTFTVTATNSAGTSAASAVSNSVTPKAMQTITFANPGTQTFGTSPTVSGTASSGLTVVFTSNTPLVCTTTNGGAITFVAAGTCTIAADQPGNGFYLAAPTVTQSFTVSAVVPGTPTIGTATAGNGQASVAFTAPASNGGSPITSYTVTSSPGGFTGTGSGSPIVVGGLTNGTAYTFTVTATTSAGTSAASTASNSIIPSSAVTAGATSATVAYDASATPITLNLSGGAPTSVAIVSGANHGTATASGTTITYTPASGYYGSDSFTYTATNSSGTSGPATVSVTISAPVIAVSPTTLAAGTVGSAYSRTLTASGGQAPYTFATAVASGALPAGLALSSVGSITGTPTAAGTYTFTVGGTDSSTGSGPASFTSATISLTVSALVPGAPTIGTATAGNGQASVTFTPPASNGGGAITSYTVTSSPGGFTGTGSASPLTVTGLANGTAYTFTVTATNSAGTGPSSAASNAITPQATQTITFANPGAQTFNSSPTLIATATSGLAVAFTSSTTAVCTVTVGGSVTFLAAGTCTINANQAGNSSYQASSQVSQSFTVTATVPGAPTVGSATAGSGQSTVSFTPPASNGGATITSYTVTASPGGAIGTGSGSPITVTGLANGTTYTFTITATNSVGTGPSSAPTNAVTPSASVTATQAIASTSLTQNHAATAFAPVTGGSGTAPLTYSVSPALPAGLTLSNTTGSITGTPTFASAATTYTVTVTDATSATATATFSLTINGAVVATLGSSPSTVTQNTAVTPFTPITGSGGTAPFTYTISPALPAALAINPATGQITGTPTTPSSATTYTVTVTDANGAAATATFTLAVAAPLLAAAKTVTAAYNANGTTSTAIDLTSSISGGVATSVAIATLPSHGTATASGLVVTYTPATGYNGADSFTYAASNATSTSVSATVSITVSAPTISSTSGTLTGGAIGVAYSQTLAPTGGTAPYTFSTIVSSGSLPAGLALSSTGVLSGTPSAACTCTFTIAGTDFSSPPVSFSLTFSLTIVSGAPTITGVAPPLGLAAGGTTVSITGTSFSNTSIVSFGSTPAASVTYVNATTLTAVAPAGTGTVDIVVTTPGGSSALSSADQFTYLAHAGALNNPLGTAVDGNGNTFIADQTLGYIVELPAGCTSVACEQIIGGGLTGLTGVTTDSSGNLYALSGGANGSITEFTYNAATNSYVQQTTIASGLNLPTTTPAGIAVDDLGNVFVTDTANHTVVEEPYNNSTGTFGAPIVLTTGNGSSTPSGIAVDGNGDVFYADPGTNTINELVPGSSTPIVLASGVNAQSVTVDASRNVYYSDSAANTITKIPFDGTAYGTPVVIATGLSAPYGLAVDDHGNLLVANNATKALVKATVDTPPSFTFASTKAGLTSTDSPQRATLANIGTGPLTIPPNFIANPSLAVGYVLDSSTTCPQVFSTSSSQTVAQGASCSYAINFSPATANVGTDAGALVLTDDNLNAANATQSIPLTGIGLADDASAVTLTLSPASPIVFGKTVSLAAAVRDTTVPATIPTGNVTFTSTNSASVGTTIATVPLSGGSATVASFKPSAAGTYTLTGNYTGSLGSIDASTGTASLVVTKADPALAYVPSPATQTYGTPIAASSLNATALDATGAPIPGTFVYVTTFNSAVTTLVGGTTVLPAATYTVTATFTPADTADYNSGGGVTATYSVTNFAATIALANLSQSYNGKSHAVTATTTPADLTVSITYNGSATPPTQGGSYPVVATIQTPNYAGTATGTLVVARVSVDSIVFVDTPDPVLTTTPVSLVATVSSSLGTPTGVVNFNEDDVHAVFATETLVNGVATFTTSAEPLGIYHLSATYLGDTNFLPMSSESNANTVLDFSVGISTIPGSTTTATVSPGGTADYQFALAPEGSPTFLDSVTFTLSGQPAGSTYTITPTTIPAGSGPTPVALIITLPQNSALLHHDNRKLAPFAVALLLLPFARRMRRTGKRLARAFSLFVLLAAAIGATTSLSGCGPASGFYGGSASGPKTYTITLTGKSGMLTHSTTVTLNVP